MFLLLLLFFLNNTHSSRCGHFHLSSKLQECGPGFIYLSVLASQSLPFSPMANSNKELAYPQYELYGFNSLSSPTMI